MRYNQEMIAFKCERVLRTAWRLFLGGEVTLKWYCERFGVDYSTARRDLAEIRRAIPTLKRVRVPGHGGPMALRLEATKIKNLWDEPEPK